MNSRTAVTQIRPASASPGSTRGASAPGQPQEPRKKKRRFVALLFFLAALLLLWIGFNVDQGSVDSVARLDRAKVDHVVNKHLIMTNKKIELAQEQMLIENINTVPSVGEQILPRTKVPTSAVDHSGDRNEMNAVRDLERTPDLDLVSPDTVIQSEIADAGADAELERLAREEYARQFIENARAGGYQIELDENFVVKSVKKIRPEDRPQLFRGGVGGAQ